MAYRFMAYIVIAFTVTAYAVIAYVVVAYIAMAYIVVVYIAMAYIVMVLLFFAPRAFCRSVSRSRRCSNVAPGSVCAAWPAACPNALYLGVADGMSIARAERRSF